MEALFIIVSVAVIVLTVFVVVLCVYLIRIIRDVKQISSKAKAATAFLTGIFKSRKKGN